MTPNAILVWLLFANPACEPLQAPRPPRQDSESPGRGASNRAQEEAARRERAKQDWFRKPLLTNQFHRFENRIVVAIGKNNARLVVTAAGMLMLVRITSRAGPSMRSSWPR